MSWESEEQHDAKERAKGADVERSRIRESQAGALRNLRVLLMPECFTYQDGPDLGCTSRRHADDCPKGMMLQALRELRSATKEVR